MSNLHVLKCEKKEGPSCPFCHKNYPCHEQGYTAESCPRVKQLVFFDCEETLSDWPYRMVEFHSYEFIGEIELDNDHEE